MPEFALLPHACRKETINQVALSLQLVTGLLLSVLVKDEPLTAVHWFLTSTQTIETLSAQDWKASVLGKGRTVETPDQVRGNQEASRDQAARILLTGSWESTCFEGPS